MSSDGKKTPSQAYTEMDEALIRLQNATRIIQEKTEHISPHKSTSRMRKVTLAGFPAVVPKKVQNG